MENNSVGGENISLLRQRLRKICVVVIVFTFVVAIYGKVKIGEIKQKSNKFEVFHVNALILHCGNKTSKCL
jgi:hypothetical protein